MVDKIFILKSIENAITTKCPTSSKARKLGETVVGSIDDDGNYVFEYDGGNKVIKFDGMGELIEVKWDDTNFDYFGSRCYEEFEYMKEQLQNSSDGVEMSEFMKEIGVESDWDFLVNYLDDFASWMGRELNSDLRNDIDDSDNRGNHLWFNHDEFVHLEKTTRIDHADYATLRFTTKIHENEDLSKLRVSDKAHSCTSVDGDTDMKLSIFGNGDFEDSWKTINLIRKDSGTTGLFFGTALAESRDESHGSEWEAEVNFAPKQKFERLLIDEENKIIIQVPVVK